MLVMANNVPIHRAAPIAIAPKPTQVAATPPRPNGTHRFEIGPPSRQGSRTEAPAIPTPMNPPCLTCQRSGAKCIVVEDEDGCESCNDLQSECSFLAMSPQSRKRKLHGDSAAEGTATFKRGFSSSSISTRRYANTSRPSTAASSLIEDLANFGGPILLKKTLGLQNDEHGHHIGSTTDFEPLLLSSASFDPQNEISLSRGTLRKVSNREMFLIRPDQTVLGHESIATDTEAVEAIVAPHGHKLIDLYFRVVHPAFPILQKHVFLEMYERNHHECSPSLLAAVYVLAVNWWDHSEELSSQNCPNVSKLEQLAQSSLTAAMLSPKISTVQAGLLLSQRAEGDGWAHTAQLVAIGQQLGLHLDCTAWTIPPWEKGLRKRLAWALYMQDKWSSSIYGRPSHIFGANWGVRGLTSNDFPDVEWNEDDPEGKQDVEQGRLLFTRTISLTQILAEILDTFFSLQAMQTIEDAGVKGTQVVLSLAKPIQLKLKEWYSNLPAEIRLEALSASSTSSKRLSSTGFLHLAYFAAEITLHRRIVRSLDMEASSLESYIQQICRSAAKARLISAMDFVNRLTPNHLRSFWYLPSKTNFALIGTFGSLLWATSPDREEADWYRRRLGEYRWTLSVNSKPGQGRSITEYALEMLDFSTGLVKELPEKPPMSRVVSTTSMAAPAQPGSFSRLGYARSSFSNLGSTGASSARSPESEEDSGDDIEEEE